VTSLSSFTKIDECHAKSGGDVLLPADFALERATNRALGFLDSNDPIPGMLTTNLCVPFGLFNEATWHNH
jgi:hypothetical protein